MAEVGRRLRAIARVRGGARPAGSREEQLQALTQSLSELLLEMRPGDERWVAEARRLVGACRQLAGGTEGPVDGAGSGGWRGPGRLLVSLDIVEAGLRRRRADVLDRGYVMLEQARRVAWAQPPSNGS